MICLRNPHNHKKKITTTFTMRIFPHLYKNSPSGSIEKDLIPMYVVKTEIEDDGEVYYLSPEQLTLVDDERYKASFKILNLAREDFATFAANQDFSLLFCETLIFDEVEYDEFTIFAYHKDGVQFDVEEDFDTKFGCNIVSQ